MTSLGHRSSHWQSQGWISAFLTLASLYYWLPPLGIWLSGCWMLTSHLAYAGPGVSPDLFSMKWLGQWLRNGDKQASHATVMVCPQHCGSRKEWTTNLEKAFREAGIWSYRLRRSVPSRGRRGGHFRGGRRPRALVWQGLQSIAAGGKRGGWQEEMLAGEAVQAVPLLLRRWRCHSPSSVTPFLGNQRRGCSFTSGIRKGEKSPWAPPPSFLWQLEQKLDSQKIILPHSFKCDA